jgi:RNA polymerase sigma factor (sigma-70 family)
MKDEVVIDKIKKGDETALEFLYKKHYKMMLNMVQKNNGTEDEAKDVYQDALIVFWEKVASGDFILTSKISTYLYSVCTNLWRKELARKKKLTSDEGNEATITMNFEQNEQIKAIQTCISRLSDTCQKVLTMYYFEKTSMNEIALQLGFSNSDTAKTKKYKCKKELDALVLGTYKASDFLD